MKLTKRLIIANVATVIIPLIITALVTLAYSFIMGTIFEKDMGLHNFKRLAEIRLELTGNQGILQRNPEIIEQESFQNYLKQQLSSIEGEILILKDDQLVFSSQTFSKIDIAKALDTANRKSDQTWTDQEFSIADISYSVELIPVNLPNGSEGKVLLFLPSNQGSSDLTNLLILLGAIFLFSFILTNTYISYNYSRTTVSPLRNLQKAAAEISVGNLDYAIVEEGDREIRELCRDLELMRLKLKDSIHTQLKYEDNRKMLVSSISHDLKTPITAIKGYIEGILDGVANTPEKTDRYLKTIFLKAQQVDRMIDDLLLYAKLDLNQIPFNFERTAIEEYLRAFLTESEPELELLDIQLTFESQLLTKEFVSVDKERLKRVITNILDNSRKYINKSPGLITVLLRETKSTMIIEIRDNGSGITPEDLPHIFTRFYRSDASRSEIKGSGLGLAIAKQIVEGHNGRIWAVSHGAEGTSIMFSLPKK